MRAIIGATAVGEAVLMAADAATGRTAIGAGPQPQTGSGVGQFVKAPGVDATPFTLPASGTWLWYYWGISVVSGAVNFAQTSGISAGGTTVASGISGTAWWAGL
ncbi:hypothetical protein B5U98_08020 [Bosea sp. Tri-39]|nr:hypothetical protein BLM15_28800 [Bosea sp. Tri-49]RXT24909.1 hypothetical protein B5U98_08020 [Bosea sp. Tri-39]RXT33461.1 hypothetical protein B5U99_18450 [Bosea sp. Tri-54]